MKSKQQTIRITNLPSATHQEDIVEFFSDRVNRKGRQVVEEIGPLSTDAVSNTKLSTVTFSSDDVAQKAVDLEYGKRRLKALAGGDSVITLDHEFKDITTLYSSDNPSTGEPDIE